MAIDPFARKAGKFAPALLMASLSVLSACTSSNAADSTSAEAAGKALGKTKGNGPTTGGTSTPTSTPMPTPTTSSVAYDTSMGNGVDSAGFADLPLNSGAHRYFVNSSSGSDGTSCSGAQNPATPKASITAAVACVGDSLGDQVLIAEGTTYNEVLPGLNGKRGFSPQYPTVFQTYDPADALNAAKYGRASGSRRPLVNSAGTPWSMGGGGGAYPTQPAGKLVIRGLNFSSAAPTDINFIPSGSGTNDYILIENCIFNAVAVTFDQATWTSGKAQHFILRNNAIYGQWNPSGHMSGAYIANASAVTFEDNVFWHNGWKVGVSRDASYTVGGLAGDEVFRHAYYIQTDVASSVIRRNLIVDGAADGGQNRGNTVITENLYIDNPTSAALGGGTMYSLANPNGVSIEFAYNAILGDADITSSFLRGEAIHTENGTSGSSAHDNLIARSRNPNGVGNYSFVTGALFNQPSYMAWNHNVVYQWASAAQTTLLGGPYPGQDFATYTNNIWDAPASGTNSNNAATAFPNPYTAAQLYAALGFADKQSFINYAIANPEAHIQRNARDLLFHGYGLN